MRRTWIVLGAALALWLGGCVSAQQREEAKEKLAQAVWQETYDRVYKVEKAAGKTDEVANGLATVAADAANEAAKKAADQVPSKGNLGQILTTLFYGIVQFGLPLLGRKQA